MNVNLTLTQISALKTMLRDAIEREEGLWLDTIEGETDAFELVRKLIDAIEREEGTHAALTEQMASRKARRDRCDARIENYRLAIAAVMECANLDKLPLAEATVSLRTLPPKIAVNDPAAVPEVFTKPVPKPDMDAIRANYSPASKDLPNWLRIEPAKPSVTIRRK